MKFNTNLKLPFYGPFYYAFYGRSLRAQILHFSRDFIKIPTTLHFSNIEIKILGTLFMVGYRAKNLGVPTTDMAKDYYQ